MGDGSIVDGDALDRAAEWARHQRHCYAEDEDRPLGSYIGVAVIYAGTVAGTGASPS